MPPPRKKKTACGAVCPRCGNNFRPQGRSAEGRRSCRAKAARTRAQKQPRRGPGTVHRLRHRGTAGNGGVWCREGAALGARRGREHVRAQKQPRAEGPGTVRRLHPWRKGGQYGCLVPGSDRPGCPPGQRARPGAKTAPGGGRRLSGCGIWVLLAPGDPCDLDAQGGQHSQAEDHAQLSQGEVCHQEQAMQSGDQQHSQEQQHAHAEGSQ